MKEINKSVDTKPEKFPYEDIINLPHHVSTKRPKMPLHDRAAQFMPFAALTGYDAQVEETARFTGEKKELTPEKIEEINNVLGQCFEMLEKHPLVEITYFEKDAKKEGGRYVTVTEKIKNMETLNRKIVLENFVEIAVENIYEISLM